MKTTRSIKYFLANHDGIEIYLSVPKADDKEQKYYLDYNYNGRKKYYGNGTVKRRAIQFFNELANLTKVKHAQIEAHLAELFKSDMELIINELQTVKEVKVISMRSNLKVALESFFAYKVLQHEEGTVDKVSLGGYKHHHKKLQMYFELDEYNKAKLIDLNSGLWLTYRVDLLNNTYSISTKKLLSTSVNQHFQYITQFYGWLIDYNELPIKNHLKKLKKLNVAKQDKRFKVIPKDLLKEFYNLLENKEKFNYTRLYLTGLLLYENNIRLSEQVLIQVRDIDLLCGTIRILNKKNDTVRTVEVSSKVKELIVIIKENTIRKGLAIEDTMYLFGGHNVFKTGKPHSHKELGTLMRRFRKAYPQFAGITLYEQKHTSITNQFDDGIDHYKIKERANHSSISTTEIYLQSNRLVKPYEMEVK